MTFMPFKEKAPYLKAYQNWINELELILKIKNNQ
jgi:xylulokinase